jgi:hypothetical protein
MVPKTTTHSFDEAMHENCIFWRTAGGQSRRALAFGGHQIRRWCFSAEAEFTLIVRAKEMAGDLAWAERYGVKLEAYQISPWLPVAFICADGSGYRSALNK